MDFLFKKEKGVVRIDKINVKAYCGCFVGESKWQQGLGDWYYEPDECTWEAVIEVDREEWEDECTSVNCPKCNAELHQSCDHFELVDNQ